MRIKRQKEIKTNSLNNQLMSETNLTSSPTEDIGDIGDFDKSYEYYKMCGFKFRYVSYREIRPDLLEYAVLYIDRNQALNELAKYVSYDIGDKIIEGIFERTLAYANREKPDLPDITINIFNDLLRNIVSNLDPNNKRINNKSLLPALNEGNINPRDVAFMSPQQIHPARWAKELEKINNKEAAMNSMKVTDIYKCSKCHDRKCITSQKQTRSADEPMTIFVTCLTCYKTWTIN